MSSIRTKNSTPAARSWLRGITPFQQRQLIAFALVVTGMSLAEMSEQLCYKSLGRALAGEILMARSKRCHIATLVARAYQARSRTLIGQPDVLLELIASDQLKFQELLKS